MRRILITTTALSLALSSFHTMPAGAQTLREDGAVIGPDGSVLCTPGPETPCDPEAIRQQLAEEAAAVQAEAERQAAEEAAAAQAEAERQAAEAAAAAQAEAERQAAEAAAAAQAEAERQAAEAAAAAQAEAERQAAEAAAAAQAEESAQADGEDPAVADDAVAVPEAAPPPAVADDAGMAPEAGDGTAAEAPAAIDDAVLAEPATPEPAAPEPAGSEPVAPDSQATSEPPMAAEPQVVPEAAAQDDAAAPERAVEAPVPEAEAVATLDEILLAPSAADSTAGADQPVAPGVEVPVVAAAAAAAAAAEGAGGAGGAGTSPAEGSPAPVAVQAEIIEAGNTRSSAEEFAPAPREVGKGRKSGLSDLEKVGLVALGALAVGAILNQGSGQPRQVVSNTGDRVVIGNPDGSYAIYKDDDAVLRRPGVRAVTESYADGSTRTVVQRADGTQVVTVRDASGRVLRRSFYDRDGYERTLIDDLRPEEPVRIDRLPKPKPDRLTISTRGDDAELRAELAATAIDDLGRKFSLRQIREIPEVRALAARIEVDSITFDTGSSVIRASEARKLADLGRLMQQLLAANPAHVFLIEGHTDAVGSAATNLLLSDRRAESLALALTEYFDIPPENLVVQGYGESELKVPTEAAERANRRVVVRLITPLMRIAAR